MLKRRSAILVLIWIVAVHLAVTLCWLRTDEIDLLRIPDDPAHAIGLLYLVTSLDLFGPTGVVGALREIHSYYPLAAHVPRAVAGLLFGTTPLVYRAANLLYLVLLLAGVYALGKRCHSERAGLLSAALVSLMPATYGGMRSVGLDFPAMCLTPLAVLCLLQSDGFRRLRAAAAFGLTAGLAVLLKGQVLLFLCWPAAYLLARTLWESQRRGDRESSKRALLGAAIAVGALLTTTAIWWGGRLGYLAQIMGSHASGEGMLFYEGDTSLLGGVAHYINALPLVLSGPLALGLVLLLPTFIRRCRHRWVLLAWLVLPLLLHMVLKVRHHRYIFQLVPAAALVLGVGLSTIRPRLRGAAALIACTVAVGLWIACSFVHRDSPCGAAGLACGEPRLGLSSLLLCGDCGYAGPPARALDRRENAAAIDMARWLRGRHPDGSGALIHYDGGPLTSQATIILQSRLGGLRLAESGLASRFRDEKLPEGWRRYYFGRPARPPWNVRSRLLFRTSPPLFALWELDPQAVWPPD